MIDQLDDLVLADALQLVYSAVAAAVAVGAAVGVVVVLLTAAAFAGE